MDKEQAACLRSRAQNDVWQKQSGAWPMWRDFHLAVAPIPPLSSLEESPGSEEVAAGTETWRSVVC